ncbi:MAG: HD domain-containing protein [Methanomassiliicoccales archaeon]
MEAKEIGVVNWFTKKRESPSCSGEEIANKICAEIIARYVKTKEKGVKGFAEVVYEVLSGYSAYPNSASNSVSTQIHEDLMRYCADTRFPVCSLYHHMKNTAAIAYILAYQAGYPDEVVQKIRTAALLHDMGKLYAPGKGKQHVEWTKKFLLNILGGIDSLDNTTKHHIIRLSTKHHTASWYDEYTASNDDEKLVALADTIASATDRTYEVVIKFAGDLTEALEKNEDIKAEIISEDSIFPHLIYFDERCDFHCKEFSHHLIGRNERIEVTLSPRALRADNKKDHNYVIPFYDEVVSGSPIIFLRRGGKEQSPEKVETIGLFGIDIQGIQRFVGGAKKLPALRGGSAIVDEVLRNSEKILSREFSPELILFSGGGNLVAFVPKDEEKLVAIRKEIQGYVDDISAGKLRVAIRWIFKDLGEIQSEFGKCLKSLFDKLDDEKKRPIEFTEPIRVQKSAEVCSYCCEGIGEVETSGGEYICGTCESKRGFALKRKISNEAETLEEISETIAVIAIDGNMMGRIFTQTKTPAEYSFKSEIFDFHINQIFKDTLERIVEDFKKSYKFEPRYKLIYLGGDDALVIVDARIAIPLAESFLRNAAERLQFELTGFDAPRPVVTFSAGVAISDYKFPIYFLIDKAHQLEQYAKRYFREHVVLDNKGLFKLPIGAMSVSCVTTSMPSDENLTFVLPRDDHKLHEVTKFMLRVISRDKRGKSWRPLVSALVNADDDVRAKLNFIKHLYARCSDKESIKAAAEVERTGILEIVRDLVSAWDVKKELEILVPMIWYYEQTKEEELMHGNS